MLKQVEDMNKQIKKNIRTDRQMYFNHGLNFKSDPKSSWRKISELLGQNKNLAPSEIKILNERNETEIISDPLKMANAFNSFFRNK